MENNKRITKLIELISSFLPNEKITIDSSRENTSSWDSLNHLNIITEVEDTYNIIFELEEITEMNSIKLILDALDKKEIKCS